MFRMFDRDEYDGYCLLSCYDVYSTMTDDSEEPTTAQLREDKARFRFVFGRGGRVPGGATQERKNSSVTTFEIPTEMLNWHLPNTRHKRHRLC